jgi:HK97 family phage prohead protease
MFDTLRAAIEEDEEDRASDPDKPYGDVTYADPGYQGDKKKRYPLDSEDHCRAAWSYINMPKNAAKYSPDEVARIKSRILAAGKKYGIQFAERSTEHDVAEFSTRSYEFELRSAGGNGRRLEGYVAVFNTRTRIPDRNGDFEELIMPGFADRSLRDNGYPVMQFDHGKDPRVGTVPIGAYTDFDRDGKGYHVRGDLFDNPVVEPVRQAIAAGAIKGMSFRFKVTKDGDKWERRGTGMDLRQVHDADVPEAGPVVFPAYAATSINLRDLFHGLPPERRAEEVRELLAEAGYDLTDLTGQPRTRSAGGGEPDGKPREGDTSRIATHRARGLDIALRPIIRLP